MSRFHISLPSMVKQVSLPFPVMIQTFLPSVMGEGDAEFCLRKSWFPLSICRRQRTAPSFRFTEIRKILSGAAESAERRLPPSSVGEPSSAEVTKIVSPQMIGVAALQLGSFVRQSTLSLSVQVTANPWAVLELPLEFGPRHCGQLA